MLNLENKSTVKFSEHSRLFIRYSPIENPYVFLRLSVELPIYIYIYIYVCVCLNTKYIRLLSQTFKYMCICFCLVHSLFTVDHFKTQESERTHLNTRGIFLNGISIFAGYLMPKTSMEKNSSGTI